LARPRRSTPPQVIHQRQSRAPTRSTTEGTRPPKTEGARTTIAHVLRAQYFGLATSNPTHQTAKRLAAAAGSLQPQELTAAIVIEVTDQIQRSSYADYTRTGYFGALRRILRFLWEHHGTPRLDYYVRRPPAPRPRNITVPQHERDTIIAAAAPYLRLWLLLCSDLAIRSGTACRLGPEHYDRQRRTLTFTTKMGEKLTLPTTAEIETLLDDCDMRNPEPFVRQLWHRERPMRNRKHSTRPASTRNTLEVHFAKLRKSLGITRRIVPHDFRRTAAVAIYRHTGDLRDAQALLGHRSLPATLHYLDHDLRPVKRSTLEIIKRPTWREQEDKSA